jgi:hypothetical protein
LAEKKKNYPVGGLCRQKSASEIDWGLSKRKKQVSRLGMLMPFGHSYSQMSLMELNQPKTESYFSHVP